ncbi:MAG: hypothetical protein M1838_005304 [Thelocarpon superellum]|nr:MAG: hypothetical protein M1838_005304 [Thelocarpon superellum]
MAPQGDIPVAANVLGVYNRHSVSGVDCVCGNSFRSNFAVPIQIQPQIFCFLAMFGWAQTLMYHDGWATWKAMAVSSLTAASFAGIEAALILTLRGPYERGVDTPIFVVGVIAGGILGIGLLPPYYEIYKRQGRVVGINMMFLTIDWFGAFFSLMALAAQRSFDVLGGSLYIVVLLLEAGIFVSHTIWMYRNREVRKRAKQAGKDVDDFLSVSISIPDSGLEAGEEGGAMEKEQDSEMGAARMCT